MSEWTRKGRSNICNLHMTFPETDSGFRGHVLLQTEPTTGATIGKIAASGKPNSAGYQRECATLASGRGRGDALGNEALQPPQMAIVNAALLQVFHRVEEVVRA